MRVVVVGATGNAGTSLLRALADEPAVDSLLGLARRLPELELPKVEWAQADINYVSAQVSVRPTAQMRVDGTLDYNDYIRRTDRSYAGKNLIPRLKMEYQLTRAIFVRAVGEYDAFEHDDLRDVTRTEFPLIIDGAKALASRSASFHGDYLFSYRPNPGTVLFAGYGSEARGDPNPADRFRYQNLVRDADHVFVKASYLWRF